MAAKKSHRRPDPALLVPVRLRSMRSRAAVGAAVAALTALALVTVAAVMSAAAPPVTSGTDTSGAILRAVLVVIAAGVAGLVMAVLAAVSIVKDRGRVRGGSVCLLTAALLMAFYALVTTSVTQLLEDTLATSAVAVDVVSGFLVLIGCLLILLPESLGD